ncbi:basic blue protein-like [Vigna unguiculata]|uniref:basic blue protein-like n=1 Tax=Vigna unguiculata TaxID=3917 RepID=UPI001016B5D4|nr:basic blue protein-like [Vigna unguiculata]
MALGRGSAVVLLLSLCFLLLHSHMAHAATYRVGGTGGWTFNTVAWPKGKRFKAGDTLVFRYSPTLHNVVAVNRGGYDGCTTPRGSKVYTSGNDQIRLAKGQNYFICNFVGHCQAGMKIAVTAA